VAGGACCRQFNGEGYGATAVEETITIDRPIDIDL